MKKTRTRRNKPRRNQLLHSLRHEPLEDRRMLAMLTVTTTDDTVDFGGSQQISDLPGSDGVISLREAILATNNESGTDVIEFDSLVFAGTQVINIGSEMQITDSVTINGTGADRLTLDATGSGDHHFLVDDGSPGTHQNVTMNGLTLTGGDSATGGGAIFNRENLTLTQTSIQGNSANINGGGVISVVFWHYLSYLRQHHKREHCRKERWRHCELQRCSRRSQQHGQW